MTTEENPSFGDTIQSHYNGIEEEQEDRDKSRIFFLRNFNNWTKSLLIDKYLNKVIGRKKHKETLRVLDLACGKGGDLFKWAKADVTHVYGVDIAEKSVETCKSRYEDLRMRRRDLFKGKFFTADCTKTRLRSLYGDPTINFSIVSCQFAFHYCFESLPQAEQMLQNISECLEVGGYFIGTLPDANMIVHRHKEAGQAKFGNDVYDIEFDNNNYDFFGAKYHFQLRGVVNCPEFLVYFPLFERLAAKYDLILKERKSFYDLFHENKNTEFGKRLLSKMKALECLPPYPDSKPVSKEPEDYEHVPECFKNVSEENNSGKIERIGTLSKSEWQVAGLYLVFAFEKVKKS